MSAASSTLHQRHAPAASELSTSSIEQDRNISGSWIKPTLATCSSSTIPSAPTTPPSLSVGTSNTAGSSSHALPRHKRGHIQKHEKIERIGLLRGSSYVKSTDKDAIPQEELTTSIGLQDDSIYDAYLPRPIAFLRRLIVSALRNEAPLHERHQLFIRRPWLDRYFVNTSLLGTHSFFLVFLPMVFWLGSPRFGRGLINVLAFGVYLSSAIKDMFCVPRPYSPPVTRLTVGTHHLEYGFPSTHSTNSVSIALYIYLWVRKIRSTTIPFAESTVFDTWLWEACLLFYAISVVYGRIYAGMHSVIDCIAGSLLGAAITAVQWGFFDQIEQFVKINSWTVPVAIIPAGLFMVSVHPQPVDDCPCFEDAIAFVSVAMGVSLARWSGIRYGITLNTDPIFHPFSSSSETFLAGPIELNATSGTASTAIPLIRIPVVARPAERWIKNSLIMVFGVINVLLLRVIVKTACKVILPPTFRLVDHLIGFSLPRRHYTQAKHYNRIPLADLSAVPSVIDLPSQIIVTDDSGNTQTIKGPVHSPTAIRPGSADASPLSLNSPFGLSSRSPLHSPVPSRTPSPNPIEMRRNLAGTNKIKPKFTIGNNAEDDAVEVATADLPIPLTQSKAHPNFVAPDERLARTIAAEVKGKSETQVENDVKRYDADVLTKVIVYTHIGLFSAGLIPALFERLGLS
ncbi:related to YSR3 - dihydrosphingosine-1-phosphate phosphatase [Melanopsichium pennsylvanicum]|uniref:Related to YSR3 - dihydrosphingosine-1-phosphate phosphatase n=2 Tax=Melanopsichium pennsylvanicum TaxID=63383 RepID=A0AAJ4XQK1_9BASI|nr:related to YSR3-dihydrosphingosine-1-phosphate phosphatase [Melanopsichium pennsylvanicum 4]SNX86067.1 related to YSR3 - dihydrosphingosine-1-phosphate phosphatase [Melanopsichium pennsylvanicum]